MTADRDTVENAVQAAAALPSVGGCDDDDRLLSAQPLPEDEVIAAKIRALREELSRIESVESLGHYDAGLALVREVHGEADVLGFTPLTAEAAVREGSLLLAAGRPAQAVADLEKALRLAIVADLPDVAAEASVLQIFAVSEGLGRHGDALLIAPYAEAFVIRSPGEGSKNLALFHNNLGSANDLAGDDVVAGREYQAAIDVLSADEGDDGDMLATIYHNLGGMYLDQGDIESAATAFENARRGFEVALGSHHPLVAHPLVGLGEVARERGDDRQARGAYEAAIKIMELGYGVDHVYLIDALVGLGDVLAPSDPRAAERHYHRVLAICTHHDVVYPALGSAHEGLGRLALARGAAGEALKRFERAVEIHAETSETTGWRHARASLLAGRAASAAGDQARAARWYEAVLASEPSPRSDRERAEAGRLLVSGLVDERAAVEVEVEVDAEAARICELVRGVEEGLEVGDARERLAEARAQACDRPPVAEASISP
ncbi:MAG: tetratricopeptide repeat protein [Nannocystaceae bacterium]